MMASFVHDMAHDFRTPLSTIKTYAYLLDKATDEAKRQHLVEVLNTQVTHLQRLLDDVLTIAQLEGDVAFECQSVDLIQVVRDVLERLEPSAAAAGLTIEADLSASPLSVSADNQHLHRAISNIVRNAIHYTPLNGVITIKAWPQANLAAVEVRDTGKGMSQATLERIFQRFYRGDEARSQLGAGSQLGLPMARKIVDRHGGGIEVESVLGQGSTFAL